MMNGEKGMTLLGIAIFVTCLFAAIALFLYHRQSFAAITITIRDWVSLASIIIAVCAFFLTYQAHVRTEKLFISQNVPVIDVSPIQIVQTKNGNAYFTTTILRVVNSSGFDAHKIRIDLKYGPIVWIGEWLKADEKKKKKAKNEEILNLNDPYELLPRVSIEKLPAWKQKDTKQQEGGTRGELSLTEYVMKKGEKGLPVLVRVVWQNEHGRIFDEVHKYKLLGTEVNVKDGDSDTVGHSFTFVPEGIAYKKDEKRGSLGSGLNE